MTADGAVGKRIILAPRKANKFLAVVQILTDHIHKGPNTPVAPKFLLRFMSLFDREANVMLFMFGVKVAVEALIRPK